MTLPPNQCMIEKSSTVSQSIGVLTGKVRMSFSIANKIFSRWQILSFRRRGVLILAIPITCLAIFPPLLAWNHFDLIEDKEEFAHLQLTNSISKELLHNTLDAKREMNNYLLTQEEHFIDNYQQIIVKATEIEMKFEEEIEHSKSSEQTISNIKAINEKYLTEMEWILAHIQVENQQPIDSQELERWLIKSDQVIIDLNYHITELSKEFAKAKQERDLHIGKHSRRGFILVCLFVLMGISGSAIAIKLFFSLDSELKNKRTQLEQLNLQLQRFTSNASHELRSPLSAILMNARVGLLTPPTEVNKIHQKLEKIIELTQNNKILINSLLFLARHEHLSTLENLEEIELNAFLSQIGDRFKELARAENLEFQTSFLSDSVMVRAQSALLAQAIDNLLDNARKYTLAEGQIQLQLSVESSQAVIKVTDNGIGIPSQSLENIFEYFYRVNSRETNQIKGFGLGLSIVKEIVRLHQGQLKVESNCDQGTTFELNFPIAPSKEDDYRCDHSQVKLVSH